MPAFLPSRFLEPQAAPPVPPTAPKMFYINICSLSGRSHGQHTRRPCGSVRASRSILKRGEQARSTRPRQAFAPVPFPLLRSLRALRLHSFPKRRSVDLITCRNFGGVRVSKPGDSAKPGRRGKQCTVYGLAKS